MTNIGFTGWVLRRLQSWYSFDLLPRLPHMGHERKERWGVRVNCKVNNRKIRIFIHVYKLVHR